jgi:hypothetical protein
MEKRYGHPSEEEGLKNIISINKKKERLNYLILEASM